MHGLPFDQPGQFFRGNLHTHSTRSDGKRTPEEVCAFYREHGYHFISITDHFMEDYGYPITDASPYETKEFITLLGAELHAGRIQNGEQWHLLAVGLPPDFAPNLPGEDGPAIARRALRAGAFLTIAHPAWYALSEADVLSIEDAHAIEIINGIAADQNDRIDSTYMLDVMLAQGRRYYALATDDAHFHDRHHDLLRGWTWVRAETLSPQAILEALKRGHYYSSTGPQIFDVQVRGSTLYVRCSPVNDIFVTGSGAKRDYARGNGITEAELKLKRLKDSPYCRVTIRDGRGGRAWTNPIWL